MPFPHAPSAESGKALPCLPCWRRLGFRVLSIVWGWGWELGCRGLLPACCLLLCAVGLSMHPISACPWAGGRSREGKLADEGGWKSKRGQQKMTYKTLQKQETKTRSVLLMCSGEKREGKPEASVILVISWLKQGWHTGTDLGKESIRWTKLEFMKNHLNTCWWGMGICLLLSTQPVMGKPLTLLPAEPPLAASHLVCTGGTATKPGSWSKSIGTWKGSYGKRGISLDLSMWCLLLFLFVCLYLQLCTNSLLWCGSR